MLNSLPNRDSLYWVSIAISLLIYVVFRGKNKAKLPIYKSYYFLIFSNLIAAILGLFEAIVVANSNLYSVVLLRMVDTLHMLVLPLGIVILTVYILYLANIDYRTSFIWHFLVVVPLLALLVGIIANNINGMMYSFDDAFHLVRGQYYYFTYSFINYYMLLWIVIIAVYRKKLKSKEINYVLTFMILSIGCELIQYYTGLTSAYTLGVSAMLIIIVFAVQSPEEIFDGANAIRPMFLYESVDLDYKRGKAFFNIFIRIHDIDVLYDSYGEKNTDGILSMVTNFLSDLHKTANVYRLNTNTFVLKLSGIDTISVNGIASAIQKRFESKFRYSTIDTQLPVGIVTLYAPDDAKNIKEYQSAIQFISNTIIPLGTNESMGTFRRNDQETAIIEAIKKAVDNNGFKVYYQPIYSTKKKKIVAAEALIRLIDDKLGFISPEIFIPLAEREGYILKIGKFVFTEVCKFYSENHLLDKGIEYIEVNLSAVQCMQYKLADEFIDIMKKHGIAPSQINFEITETSAMISNSAVSLNINSFVDNGIDLSLDDYGTGYSNISYLYHMPFAFVKIDKSLLWSADKNDKANITLINTVKMAKNLNMRIVVEGVETEEHVKKLLKLECDYFQGYYFSKPVPGVDFVSYVDNFTVPAICMARLGIPGELLS